MEIWKGEVLIDPKIQELPELFLEFQNGLHIRAHSLIGNHLPLPEVDVRIDYHRTGERFLDLYYSLSTFLRLYQIRDETAPMVIRATAE